MMKSKLFLFFLLFSQVILAQLYPARVMLKDGTLIDGITGKLKKNTFKYKNFSSDKAKEIDFSNIDFVQIRFAKDNIKKYFFFQTLNNDKFSAVEELVIGKRVELYVTYHNVYYDISSSYTVIKYYVKKPTEEKLLFLGEAGPLNNLKEKILNYFADCEALVKKIKDRDFKMRDGLEQIAQFYNENCDMSK